MVSVVIPVLNEAATVAGVVRLALAEPLVDEVIVVDDASLDDSVSQAEAAGARVIQSTMLGKGASMADGTKAARNPCVLFLDGDLRGLQPGIVEQLAAPILRGAADFVKAGFSRSAGRVTILTVKPLLKVFFPELARFNQPIGGIFAARRELLLGMDFEIDYGVDIGLLIDASRSGARLAEVDIGSIEHDSQSLDALGRMAQQVLRVILERAESSGRLDAAAIAETRETERHALAGMEGQIRQHGEARPVVLLAIDGVILPGEFAGHLALRTRRLKELARARQLPMAREGRLQQMLKVFRGLPQRTIEKVARELPLNPSGLKTVAALRRLGYRVCLVSDLFHSAAEVIRRRVYADLCFANLARRSGPDGSTCELVFSPLFKHQKGCERHIVCSGNVVRHLKERYGLARHQVLAVGQWPRDMCLLQQAGQGFAFDTPENLEETGLAGGLHGRLEDLAVLCGPAAQLRPHGAGGQFHAEPN